MHIYGIKNCNSVKKAFDWLASKNMDYTFHDFKKEGLSEAKLKEWVSAVGWEALLNKRGTTWRKISKEDQERILDADTAVTFMLENTSAIKRPVVETTNKVYVGLDPEFFKA